MKYVVTKFAMLFKLNEIKRLRGLNEKESKRRNRKGQEKLDGICFEVNRRDSFMHNPLFNFPKSTLIQQTDSHINHYLINT